MNRFASQKEKKRKSGFFFTILVFILILIVFLLGMRQISTSSQEEQEKNLELTLREACIQCYAVEGFYPDSLDYLMEHYGITYNKEKYFIDYKPVASNLMPEIVIIRRKSGGGSG